MSIQRKNFGTTPDGQTASLFTLTNPAGVVVKLTDFGAIVTQVHVPDRTGQMANITLGFDSLDGYLQKHPCFGATIGRFGNRIARGTFELDGKEYRLATNHGPNHLHGGVEGFHRKLWEAEGVSDAQRSGVRFRRVSSDGEEGYPGNLQVQATYSLTRNGELVVEFEARTDAPTILNLTNHCYWNLGGAGSGSILDHRVRIAADGYVEVGDGLIPTGRLLPVDGTPLDLRTMQRIGASIDQLPEAGGYDHCYVLRGTDGELSPAARAEDPASGRWLEILTTQPGIQFYTGNSLNGSTLCGGHARHTAFCLETQHFPDSPHHDAFPSTVLRPGEIYQHRTIHRFGAQ